MLSGFEVCLLSEAIPKTNCIKKTWAILSNNMLRFKRDCSDLSIGYTCLKIKNVHIEPLPVSEGSSLTGSENKEEKITVELDSSGKGH